MDDILASKMSRPGEGISLRSLKLDCRCIIEAEDTPILKSRVLQFKTTNSYPGGIHGLIRTNCVCASCRTHRGDNPHLVDPAARERLPGDVSLHVCPNHILRGAI